MPRPWLLVLMLTLARPAAAENEIADSIEWMTADADAVVIGTIVTPTAPAASGAPEPAWVVATIDVAATLVGPRSRRVTVAMRAVDAGEADAWHGRQALFFLVARDRAARDPDCAPACDDPSVRWALRPGVGNDGVVMLDATDGEEVYTATFDVLRARARVLAAVRAAARSRATRGLPVVAPRTSRASRALYGGSAVRIVIPIDAAAEARARTWITAPALAERLQGARVLAARRSPANIRRLQALLADPGVMPGTAPDGSSVDHYPVRALAHDTLVTWKIAHPTPIIDQPQAEPLDGPRPATP